MLLGLSIVLLLSTGAGTYLIASSIPDMFPASPHLGDSLTQSITLLGIIASASFLASIVVALIAVTGIRRERLHRRQTEARLQRALKTADQAGDLIAIVNRKGKIEYINRTVEQMTGFSQEELKGTMHRPWLPWYAEDQAFDAVRQTVLTGGSYRGLVSCRRKDGTPFLIDEHVTPVIESNGGVVRFISTARDVTRLKQIEDRLDYLDRYDPVTGIPNRRSFGDLLKREIEDCERAGGLLAVMVLDIDRFKPINDIFGAEVGDEVLRQITRALRTPIGPRDCIARLGSDEFGIIHRYDMQHLTAHIIAERVQHAMEQKIFVGGHEIILTASIGLATYPDDAQDAVTLQKYADMALSRAKARGRNTIQHYSGEMNDRIFEFYVMEKRLSDALLNSEYQVEYQPYCDLAIREVVGAEALIRWSNDEIGTVSPGRFIPSLEESGQIVDVGAWVLKKVCRQIREWNRIKRSCPIAVNLSHVQFRHKDLVTMVANTIRELNIDPRQLTLEMTESICIHDMDFTISVLKKLKDTGVSLSIDDFGTGYSSLSYIKKLPVDTIKIDIAFVRDVSKDPDAASIISAITGMARGMDLKTIAEGVETEEQRNILHLLRCDMGQGYYFSPAVPAKEFELILTGRHESLIMPSR
jgi:diguanylate cyclase (GGDEF)-like protein/PAS domain S-box-containing protein